ncbi:MAG TPA: PopZ family protein [Mesorhizobium sp.]|uniref:PopZ family protein n=1 Tax=Mesorhizobium sp. TaxID=1871066 RepID=UPI002DDCAF2F|nr:PopZ family protein [Mesorhizobium sp.]HEV2504372.1 PopZ family protein [Mesorhizobium sp.]
MATAASSAQREPSMEEILASIRRIIEDSDTGRKTSIEAIDTRQDIEPITARSEPVENSVPDVDAFRSELRDELPGKPISLADVQAQLAAGSPEQRPAAPVITLAEIGALTASEQPATAVPQPVVERDEALSQIRAGWPREVELVADTRADEIPGREDSVFTTQPGSDVTDERVEFTTRHEPAIENAVLRPALISEHTSRQVAASFEELSEAFAGRAKKTFDDMAAEMLRPMLQDWLDNNLPTLVERLVREEIERVARGS